MSGYQHGSTAKKSLRNKIEYFLAHTAHAGTPEDDDSHGLTPRSNGVDGGLRLAFASQLPQHEAGSPGGHGAASPSRAVFQLAPDNNGAAMAPADPTSKSHLYGLLRSLQRSAPEQAYASLQELFNLAADNPNVCASLYGLNAVDSLTPLLSADDVHVRILASYILSALASEEKAVQQMVSVHTIEALIAQLAGDQPVLCRKAALRALGKMARWPAGATEFLSSGGLRPLVAHLFHSNATIVRRCLIALYNLSTDKEETCSAIAHADAVPAVLRLCSSNHAEVQRESVNLLRALVLNEHCRQVRITGPMVCDFCYVSACLELPRFLV